MVRRVATHAVHFLIHVLLQALSGASRRQESRECAALFLPPTHLSQTTSNEGGAAMKLYKYMNVKNAYDYLHSGEIEVEKCDDQNGVISFSIKPWADVRPMVSADVRPMVSDGVVLEVDEPDNVILPCKDCCKIMQVELSSCRLIGASYFYRLNPDFRLDSFTILSDCQINWKYVRSCLKRLGKVDTAITLLKIDANNGTPYRDKEYRTDDRGLYCLKHNPNHTSVRDKSYVEDVICDCSGVESINGSNT